MDFVAEQNSPACHGSCHLGTLPSGSRTQVKDPLSEEPEVIGVLFLPLSLCIIFSSELPCIFRIYKIRICPLADCRRCHRTGFLNIVHSGLMKRMLPGLQRILIIEAVLFPGNLLL